jgi:hypothetical protein
MFNNLNFLKLFRKKPKFEFYNLFAGFELINPPEKAGSYYPKWLKAHTSSYKKQIEKTKDEPALTPLFTLTKCPGIKNLITRGIHLKAWQDIYIELYPDGGFSWKTPVSVKTLKNGEFIDPEIQYHPSGQFPEFTLSRDDTFQTIIKIMTPWRAKMPDDWAFILSPVYYGDDPWFSPIAGIWDASFGGQLNINMQIHKKVGKFLIKGGTPIVKLIPVQKREDFDLVVRQAKTSEIDEERFVQSILHSKANTDHKLSQLKINEFRKKFKKCPFLIPQK